VQYFSHNKFNGGTIIFSYRTLHALIKGSVLGFLLIFITVINCPGADSVPKAADLVADNQPIDLSSARYQEFFLELEEKHQFTRAELMQLFEGLQIDQKVLQLMDKQWEAKPYYEYWPLFITPAVIATGRHSLLKYRLLFDRIEAEYGVDREFIVAIWGIESRFGTNQGGFNLFRSLNTLFDAYPRRSDFFRKELIHFLVLCRDNGIDPLKVKGSYAGAFGQAQFMPSSFSEYAVDFDGDNRRDLIHSKEDIFASIANYLRRFGWTLHAPVYIEIGNALTSEPLVAAHKKGRTGRVDWQLLAENLQQTIPHPPQEGQLSIVGLEESKKEGGGMRYVAGYPNFQAITEYNHSNKYAMAVTEMAEAFKK
jgi:membrane-bound lytic murein transglycosylase B